MKVFTLWQGQNHFSNYRYFMQVKIKTGQDIYIFSSMIKAQKAYVENWCHLDTDHVEEMKIQSQRERMQ